MVAGYKQTLKRSKAARDAQERLSLKMPVIGDLLNKSAIARFARTLSTTFAAGVPLVDALESVAGAAGNVVYFDAIKKIKNDVSSGIQLNYAMKQSEVFPNMVIQMVAIGEESGALDSMLDKAATYYEEMVDNAVDGLTSLMEPIIMSFLGVVIGGLIIAMYLPIFKMGDAISGGG
ncbi:MAG: type IV pilus assembly protein PilC [Candidatus Azotimanducaceae bacterium]|jgi:type IV pilus assembly protein PilC